MATVPIMNVMSLGYPTSVLKKGPIYDSIPTIKDSSLRFGEKAYIDKLMAEGSEVRSEEFRTKP
eukprot:3229548-Amphidinium_carterae.1